MAFFSAALAQGTGADVEGMLERLADPETRGWEQIEADIMREWSKSGSPAMDLLLQRGNEALAENDTELAIDHFTALVDHAPDFSQGWNARATAYYQAGLYGPAMSDIARALELNPRHFGALAGLAIILDELDEKELALQAYRRVEEVNPHREELGRAIERLEQETGGRTL
ncbi:tetratricopeptide repeat protein [Tropicimonas sp. IMCC34011]|uniref:tetratricopeptide repeat protein n=1 Tax=Tropicimonas sp. IMCC34011 TaxID=2248759 RepID=UPI001E40CC06|nr:tetratricopeptide repeat protein [Tropicimonas sp. IMCC34011]